MMERFTVAIDAMGGDLGAAENVRGAVLACAETEGLNIVLVGKEDVLRRELEACEGADKQAGKISIQNASQAIENSEQPTAAIKEKKDSSIAVGLRLVKEGGAKAFVSSGSTGALLTGATLIVGRLKVVLRPALGTCLPGVNGFTFLIDVGANLEAKPEYLAQFGAFGAAYVKCAFGNDSPTIGLINVGAEKEKGTQLTKEAHALLARSRLDFKGNIEAREIPFSAVDVAVCDAFVGNALLKFAEGFSKAIMSMLKTELTSDFISSVGAAISRPALRRLRGKFDYKQVGGAPFLGLNGLVVKAHGNSNRVAIKSAIQQCAVCIKQDINTHIMNELNY